MAVLSIAGSDSGGGAGIQADLKTFEAHRVFGTTVITALTAQNTVGVQAAFPIPAEMVRAQLRSILDDFPIAAANRGRGRRGDRRQFQVGRGPCDCLDLRGCLAAT